ncbi:unnamed protein product [Protopolystoma xenopodis]|uniref:Reverse transcriptase domain-containing protein n=1 Tax=Protopolystoma xenopodis TaxID=117903 RepID=A0A448WH38_9PLAT|nr:unnamed protein product [Protopolystoma xenopodis]
MLDREEDILESQRIRRVLLTGLINLTIRTNYLTFNGNIYEQIFGLPMGSPLSPLLANAYQKEIEENFKRTPLQPAVLMRYLDDYFAFWSHGREKLEEFLNFVNQINEKIKFAMKAEEGEWLPFLDVEVIRSNGTLKNKFFKKKSYAGIILNFRSHHNYRLKLEIMSMIIRSLRLTDVEFWDKELDKLTRIFLYNGYPSEVIQRNIRAVKPNGRIGTIKEQ